MTKYFYVTTAIDYPNGPPHIGHVYEKIVADTYARWYRWLGQDVYFLTGTDENGQKLVKAAQAEHRDTRHYVDENVEKFKKICTDLELTHDDFIRTTEPRHFKTAHQLWSVLEKKGDIYFDRYSGYYCFSCEAFYLDSQIEQLKCPVHHTKLEFIEEDGYFFKMSRYQDFIVSHIKSQPDFIFPESARKHLISRLEKEELKDLSISRPNTGWGVPVPSNHKHVIYTWFDALINYYSAVDNDKLKKYWPATMHVIGKDITWFHCVIWPIMLHAADLALPEQVHVHGMVLAEDGKKMSKSLGNVIDPYDLINKYPLDLMRYYLLRAIASGQDGCFSVADMVKRNNNELANDFGNLVLRVTKLARKRLGDKVDCSNVKQDFDLKALGQEMLTLMNKREHNRALDSLWGAINKANGYLNAHEPWRIKDDLGAFKQIIYNALYNIHCFAALLTAFLPDTAKLTFKILGTTDEGLAGLTFGKHLFHLSDADALFKKIE